MGIIQRQSIKQTVVNYAATAIAAVSTLFIYPLEEELYGLWLTMFGLASFFLPFASLGINAVTVRFFPGFKDPKAEHRGFLPFLLVTALVCFGLFVLLLVLFKNQILGGLTALNFNVSVLETYFIPTLTLTLLLLVNGILTSYISNFQRIVVPGIFNQFWPKIALPVLILLAYLGYLDLQQYVWGILCMQAVSLIGLLFYLNHLGELRLKPSLEIYRSGKLREMATFALYGTLGSLGTIFAFRIDHIMISMLVNVSSTGIYGIAQFIGASIEMPTRSIYAIAAPIITKAWEEDDREEIRMIYQKSSLNLLLLGLPVFGLIVLSLDDLFQLTSKYELLSQASWVVYLIGMGKLADMAFSVNGQIIGYSRYFRVNLLAVIFLGILNVILNYRLIPEIGIEGAAWASFISITAFNAGRSLFVWIVWRMQPFSWRTGLAVMLALLATAVAWLLPDTGLPVLDIFQNSLLLILLYVPAVLGLKISPEVNELAHTLWKRISKK